MTDAHDDFRVEPIRGLPETPPEGEQILWQGAPDWRALAVEAFSLRWVAGYFVLLAAWRYGAYVDIEPGRALAGSVMILGLGAGACALLAGLAWVQARATVYTITNRRVAMRIGAALTVTLNLPHVRVGAANLRRGARGTGTIALALTGETRFSYLVCWPHVRPWRMARTEPALRCIPEVDRVAALLAEAAEARITEAALAPRHAAPAHPAAIAAE